MIKNEWFTDHLEQELYQVATCVDIPKGQIFVDDSYEDLHSYILIKGKVRIIAKADPYDMDGHADIILNDLGAPDVIGEIAAIDGKPHSSVAQTLVDSQLFRLPADQFKQLMDKHQPIRDHVMRRLCDKIRDANERLRDNCVFNANLRVTREVIRLADDSTPSAAGEATIDDFPKHHILASRCGVTRETVSRVLGKLIKDEVIIRSGKHMVIKDVEKLANALSKNSEGKAS